MKMENNSVTEIASDHCLMTLDRDNVDELFEFLSNRRDIRGSVVTKLLRVLEAGDHFETPIMTNCVDGVHRLLDGNHRVEAIRKYLTKHPDRKIEVFVFYYSDLDTDREKQMYTKWNLGIKQNTNDFVKQYWDDIPIARTFEKDPKMPYKVGPKWAKGTMEFKTLLSAYLNKDRPNWDGAFDGSAMEFIERSQELGHKDAEALKQFLKEFTDVFGPPDNKNLHYKQAVFLGIQRIWCDNRSTKTPEQMKSAFKRLLMHERVQYYSSYSFSRENCKFCRTDLLGVINGQKKTNRFK